MRYLLTVPKYHKCRARWRIQYITKCSTVAKDPCGFSAFPLHFAVLTSFLSLQSLPFITITPAIKNRTFAHLMELPVSYFDLNQTGDIISRISYDIDTVNASLSNDLVQIVAIYNRLSNRTALLL